MPYFGNGQVIYEKISPVRLKNLDGADYIFIRLHITDFFNLKPGTKLKIPVISNQVLEALEETEPFVEEYYPKAKEIIKNESINEKNEEMKEENRACDEAIPSTSKSNKPKERNNFYQNPKIRKI